VAGQGCDRCAAPRLHARRTGADGGGIHLETQTGTIGHVEHTVLQFDPIAEKLEETVVSGAEFRELDEAGNEWS
jgi:hypothetical protein